MEPRQAAGLSSDTICVIDDEMRALIASQWPHLLAKLPTELMAKVTKETKDLPDLAHHRDR